MKASWARLFGRCVSLLLCIVLWSCENSLPVTASPSAVGRAGCAAGTTPDGPDIARGTVYLDQNRNGVRNDDEPGIPNVSVSNGLDVVQTDCDGRYAISLPDDSIVFVSKPAQYDVPTDKNLVPQFFYSHYPEGTPPVAAWVFPVTGPTGPLPEAIDFALLPPIIAHGPDFEAMVFADTQAMTEEEEDMMREDIFSELVGNPLGAEFGLTVGDVVFDNLALYPRHQAIMGTVGIPMWYLPGNHDTNAETTDPRYALETYKRYFGPSYYSFDYGNVHFLSMENVAEVFSQQQLQWVRNDLKFVSPEKLIVICTHVPFLLPDGTPWTTNLAELLDALKGFDNLFAMAGHDTSNSWKSEINHTHGWTGRPFTAHTLAEVRGNGWNTGPRDDRNVRAATMQDGNPNGYYLVSFRDRKVQPRFIPASDNPGEPMRFFMEPQLLGTTGAAGQVAAVNRGVMQPGTKLVINVFDGGERNVVQLSLDGAPAVRLEKVLRTDPYMEQEYQKHLGTTDMYSAPEASSHIWEFALPANLTSGLHTVTVNSMDEYDQYVEASFTFELL